MSEYCGLANGICSCKKRIGYAIKQQRLNRQNLEYSTLTSISQELILNNINAMEVMDVASDIYNHMKKYSSPQKVKDFLHRILNSNTIEIIQKTI